MIFPEIFDGCVMGFFTDKELGTSVEGLTGKRAYFPKQEHTDIVINLNSDTRQKTADAVITTRADVVIGIKTADCVPILVFDRVNEVMGAVHAGWRGTAKGIIKKTIEKMREKYKSRPEDILLAMGPSIKMCCYAVGPDVLEAIKEQTGEGDYFKSNGDKHCVDIQAANKLQALGMGVPERNISMSEDCTYCSHEKYYSYRFDKKTKGRQGGFICKA